MNDEKIMLDLQRRSLVVILKKAASWKEDNLYFYYVNWDLKLPRYKQAVAVAPRDQFIEVTPLCKLLYET